MILICSKCSTQYLVADAAIGKAGRTVRCANCGYSWFQDAPSSLEPAFTGQTDSPPISPYTDGASQRRRPLPPGSNLPVVVVTRTASPWIKRICVMLATAAVVLTPFVYRKAILDSHPEFSLLFEPFGIYYTQGLALADVSLTKFHADNTGNTHYVLNCGIVNEAKDSRALPAVAATLLDSDGHAIATSPNLADRAKNLAGGALTPCAPYAFDVKSSSVASVRIDLADLFDLTLRQK